MNSVMNYPSLAGSTVRWTLAPWKSCPADTGGRSRVAASDASPAGREITALRLIDLAAESLIVAALLGELVLVLANVAARIYFQRSFLWTDEIARLALSILAFIGGAVAYRRRDHAFVRVILSRLPSRGERGCLALADVVVLFVAGLTGLRLDRIPRFELGRIHADLPDAGGVDRIAASGRHGAADALCRDQSQARSRHDGAVAPAPRSPRPSPSPR